MPAERTVGINPQMVTLARMSRGLTQAALANEMDMAQGTISKIEGGGLVPDESTVEGLATALGYPPPFFYLRDALDGPSTVEFFHERRRKAAGTNVLSKAYATATIRRLHVQRLMASAQDSPENFPHFPRSEFGDPARIARTVRAHWELPIGPVFSMTEAVENAGGIIAECDFETRHIDGFSRWKRPNLPPLFFMSGNLPPDRWRWTVAHELAHLVMHTGEMPAEDMEQEADQFAEEFLMPANVIKSQLGNARFETLARLKQYWKVSIQALIQRAYHLDVISARQRSHMFMQWSKAGYRLREPSDLDPPREPPKALSALVDFHLSQLSYSESELAHLLGLRTEEFRTTYLAGPRLRRLK